jgi:Flp pilus assembly protein TadG
MTARDLARDQSAATAAEFALVLPLLLIFLFGVIDAGRWMWAYNQAEKATQMGARMAIVTDYVSSSIGSSYVGSC